MQEINFKYACAKNFLCFGEEGIEIDFESFGNIVLIRGQNLDVVSEDGNYASNGSGKSSIPEVITYALYGRTIKKPKKLNHGDLINNQIGKKLYTELIWDEYRVVRTREPTSLRFWKSAEGKWNKDTEISKGKGTQKLIEDTIGLNYETFVNLFIFSDDNTLPFLECDSGTKREIVENLLSLEKYRTYSENAKGETKKLKEEIKLLGVEYRHFLSEVEGFKAKIEQIKSQEEAWKGQKKRELGDILKLIKIKRDGLEKDKSGAELAAYADAQEEIAELHKLLPRLEAEKKKFESLTLAAEEKSKKCEEDYSILTENHDNLKRRVREVEYKISKNEASLKEIEDKKVQITCPYCLGEIKEENFIHLKDKITLILNEDKVSLELTEEKRVKIDEQVKDQEKGLNKIRSVVSQIQKQLSLKQKTITDAISRISELSKIKKPEATDEKLLMQQEIDILKKKAIEKKEEFEGDTPFKEILESSINDLKEKEVKSTDKKRDIEDKEKELPYYEFWVKAFGDSGIRKYIIDGIIPTLNARLEYLLQFLVDNKIKLEFNNELEEKVDKYPFNNRPYVYHGMSGGQRRRLNLAISQAWAYVMMLSCGTCPSAIFLDEVTMNMDEIGIQCIYRFICELAREKQVFVIDHNKDLLEMLSGCDLIHLQMQNEVSKRIA